MWEKFYGNLNSERLLAKFINQKGVCIYMVYEASNHYYAKSEFNFLQSIQIPYHDVQKICKVSHIDSVNDYSKNCLDAALEKIEDEYFNQISKIHAIIG